MAEEPIEGMEKLLLRMQGVSKDMLARTKKVVRTTAVRIANHAKAGHTPGEGHGAGRYENQTSNLTNSIQPGRVTVSDHIVEGSVFATMEYAAKVEVQYPFMKPAELSQEQAFKDNFAKAVRGAKL